MAIEKIKSAGQDEVQAEAQALSSQAVARRHMLLKGLGKGSAVLAATVPIQTLAGQSLLTTADGKQCSVSGMQSGVHSATTSSGTCGGYSPGYYKKREHWPSGQNGPNPDALVTTIFKSCTLMISTGGGSSRAPTLLEVMNSFTNTDEFHWICAWLNAYSHVSNFPYSADQVVAFYNTGPGSTVYQNALAFFKKYMENI